VTSDAILVDDSRNGSLRRGLGPARADDGRRHAERSDSNTDPDRPANQTIPPDRLAFSIVQAAVCEGCKRVRRSPTMKSGDYLETQSLPARCGSILPPIPLPPRT
jgi:hypothetical protein